MGENVYHLWFMIGLSINGHSLLYIPQQCCSVLYLKDTLTPESLKYQDQLHVKSSLSFLRLPYDHFDNPSPHRLLHKYPLQPCAP